MHAEPDSESILYSKIAQVMELPDDLLTDVFRRLRPRGLDAVRCVHSSWRAIIDTRRYSKEHFHNHDYIVFDPAVSPHYEVLVVPQAPYKRKILDPRVAEWEWPPLPMLLHDFSSRMNRWEERSFELQGEAFATVTDVPWSNDNKCGVYWRGDLYVHHYFVMR